MHWILFVQATYFIVASGKRTRADDPALALRLEYHSVR